MNLLSVGNVVDLAIGDNEPKVIKCVEGFTLDQSGAKNWKLFADCIPNNSQSLDVGTGHEDMNRLPSTSNPQSAVD